MGSGQIPNHIDPPPLSPSLIDEITGVNFGEPIDNGPCDLIFIFGGSHPGLWEKFAEAYFKGYGKDNVVTGGHKPGAMRHHTWVDKPGLYEHNWLQQYRSSLSLLTHNF